MHGRLIGAGLVGLLWATVGCEKGQEQAQVQENFVATLSGENEGPSVSTDATGTATFTLDDLTVSYTVEAASITNVAGAHIHSGPAGENGPPRVTLFAGPTTGVVDSVLASGAFTSADVRGITFDELLTQMRDGTAYVNVHTEENPAGEIRGQVRSGSPPQALAGKIAFMQGGKIWIIDERMNVHRPAPWHRLVAEPGFDRPLTWSPDGSKLLFWNHGRGWDIWVMHADGTNRKNLTRTRTGGSRSPSWSPDGRKIAFMRDNPRGLYLMSADGRSQERLSTRGHRDEVPAWSPDGRRIAYTDMRPVGEDGVALDIWVVDADGQHEIRVVEYGRGPTWSPDGEHLLFVRYRRGSSDLFLVALDGNDEVNLTNSIEAEWNPVRSPDGSQIAYLASADSKTELRLMDANGKNPQRLTDVEGRGRMGLSWSPDGDWLTFVSGAEGEEAVYIIGINGQNLRKLVDGGAHFPAWQPAR